MSNETPDTLDEIEDTKEDYHFTVCTAEGEEDEDEVTTAGVKVWELEKDQYYIRAYYDFPGCITDLGDPVNITAASLDAGSLPPEVVKAVQDLLFLGIDNMTEQGLPIDEADLKKVHNMA